MILLPKMDECFFKGNIEDIIKTNINLRTADRIKILLKEFKALDFETLYDQIFNYDWAQLLPVDAKFPVSGRSVKSKLHSEPDIQSIVKKAIVDKMTQQYHRRGFLPETGNLYHLDIYINKDIARISLDTTGESLFKKRLSRRTWWCSFKRKFCSRVTKIDPLQWNASTN